MIFRTNKHPEPKPANVIHSLFIFITGVSMEKTNTKTTIQLFVVLFLTLFSTSIFSQPFTNYYYYEGKPYDLTWVSNQVFLVPNDNVSELQMESLFKDFPLIQKQKTYSAEAETYFLTLNKSLGDAEFSNLIHQLKQRTEVKSASPVFKMPEGKGKQSVQIGVLDQVIVQFKQNKSLGVINEFINSRRLRVVQQLDLSGGLSFILQIPDGQYAMDVANEIYLSDMTNYAEPNLYFTNLLDDEMRTNADPNDPYYSMQWSHRNTGNNIPGGVTGTPGCDMSVDSAWIYTKGSPNVVVSIVDTGIDTLHEDLADRIIHGISINTYSNLPYAWDDQNHGTATSGIVAAIHDNNKGISGVAPLSMIFGVKIFNAAGNTSSDAITNGMIAAWQRGSWVSNNSWGGGSPVSAANNAIADGVNLGRNGKGVVWCFATGNDNAGSISWPSSLTNVISVGGLSPCNQRKSPSSCDGESWWGANYGTGLCIVAPAVKIYATDRSGSVGYTSGNYVEDFNGTSSATPNTTGVCALVLAVDSSLTWQQVKERICATATKVGSYSYTQQGPLGLGGWNNEMGYGRIDAYQVVKYTAENMVPPCPIDPAQNPTPAHGTINLPVTGNVLNWTNGAGVNQVEVWFGTQNNMTKVYDGTPVSSFSLASFEPLPYFTNYTWQVKGKIDTCFTPGPVWSFKTMQDPNYVQMCETFQNITNWTIVGPAGMTNWSAYNSSNAGGTSPELKLTWSPQFNGVSKIRSASITLPNNQKIDYSFKFYLDYFASPSGVVTVGITYDGGTTSEPLYTLTNPTGDVGPTVIVGSFTTPASGNSNIQIEITYNGNVYNINDIYWDDFCFEYIVPVELTSFAAATNGADVELNWKTATETNNQGFQIERKISSAVSQEWKKVGYVAGFGTTTEAKSYSFVDTKLETGNYTYRLKQIDFDGSYSYSSEVEVNVELPLEYRLEQNYPNPFNPSTVIKYSLPEDGLVKLAVYNILGEEVSAIVNNTQKAGRYEVTFNGNKLASGVYVYRLETANFTSSKKFVLLR